MSSGGSTTEQCTESLPKVGFCNIHCCARRAVILSLKLKESELFFPDFPPASDVSNGGYSCEAGAPRQGPKKERRDSMIHKAE